MKKGWLSKSIILSLLILAALLASMVYMGFHGLIGTPVYPIVVGVFMAAYWVVTDVLDVKWENRFEGKKPSQIKAYYTYALCDLVGLAGLVYFLSEMRSMTGVMIYVFGTFMKRKYNEEFRGEKDEEESESEVIDAVAEEVPTAEITEKAEAEEASEDSE